jgi:hypothetical protein
LLTDLNDWWPGDDKTFAPHGSHGPIRREGDYLNTNARGLASQAIGAVGGNVARLDGSVSWKKIQMMQIYRGSFNHSDGCIAAW